MPRHILDEQYLHTDIRDQVAKHHAEIVETVKKAIDMHDVVVVGMAQNPMVTKARKAINSQTSYLTENIFSLRPPPQAPK